MSSQSHQLRKLVAGLCLVAAPILVLASAIISPKLDTDGKDQLALAAAHADRWFIANVVGLAALALMVPAIMGLIHMLRERQVLAGFIGGGLALLGVLAATAATGMSLVLWEMTKPGLDTTQMGTLADRIMGSTGIQLAVFVPTACFLIGMVDLAFGLLRARAVPALCALALAVGAAGLTIGLGPAASIALAIAGAGVLLVGMLPIGWAVLMESEEAWEHTPQFSGFHQVSEIR
jgi:hypothetical protein